MARRIRETASNGDLLEEELLDALEEKLEVSRGDAQGILGAAQLSKPELFDGTKRKSEILEVLLTPDKI